MSETVTSPGEVANVFAPGISDDDDAELAKLHGDDDEDDEVKEDTSNYYCYTTVLCRDVNIIPMSRDSRAEFLASEDLWTVVR